MPARPYPVETEHGPGFSFYSPAQTAAVRALLAQKLPLDCISRQTGVPFGSLYYVAVLVHRDAEAR